MVDPSLHLGETRRHFNSTPRRGLVIFLTAVALGASPSHNDHMVAQATEVHAALSTQQFGTESFLDSPEKSDVLAPVIGQVSSARTVRVELSRAKKREIPDNYRCDGKDGKPVPGWRYCPKVRGDDVVPQGGWKVAPKGSAYKFVSAGRQVISEELRKPVMSSYKHANIPVWLRYRVPYNSDDDRGFAPTEAEIFKHLTSSQIELLEKIRNCESHNNPRSVSPGGKYTGLYQSDTGYEGAYAGDLLQLYKYRKNRRIRSSEMTRGEQDIMAIRGIFYGPQGRGAFPVCGK